MDSHLQPADGGSRSAVAPTGDCGIGLRAAHYQALRELTRLGQPTGLGVLEVHSENYFADGGRALAYLDWFAAHYPISLHGVGMNLGSADPLCNLHLAKLKRLITRVQPPWVSDHLCWVGVDHRYVNDLMPVLLTPAALEHIAARIDQVQTALGVRLLIENITQYVAFDDAAIPEPVFLNDLCERSGCGLLLDLNNIYVNSVNHAFDPSAYVEAIHPTHVLEVHLGGFEAGPDLLIDTHGAPVSEAVWRLYEQSIARWPRAVVVIERDQNLPPLADLLAEATRAAALRTVRLCAA